MTHEELLSQIHIEPDGGEVIFITPTSLTDEDKTWLNAHRDFVRETVAARRDAAGFYVCFPPCLEKILHHSRTPLLSLDLETTNLTPYSPPIKMNKRSEIGGNSYSQYRVRFPKSEISTIPRARILAVQAIGGPCPGDYIFDLDKLEPSERQRLIDTVVDGHTIIGHNVIGFDGFWLMKETTKRPKRWLDTLILVRQCKPEILLALNHDAATGTEDIIKLAIEMLEDGDGKERASLECIAMCLFRQKLNKQYQRPANWCVSELSPEHYQYVIADISLPVEIVKHIFGTVDIDTIVAEIKLNYPHYIPFMRAAQITASAPGVPFSEEKASILSAQMKAEILDRVKTFVEERNDDDSPTFPEFTEESLTLLRNPAKGLNSKVLIADIEKHAENHDLKLYRTKKNNASISGDAMTLSGLDKELPCWSHLSKIADLKLGLRTIEQFCNFSKVDGLIHPLVCWVTEAGRANCRSPNLQGTPRNSALRGLIEAKPGWRIISKDFSGIELRVAVCNAERAIQDTLYRLSSDRGSDTGTGSWYLEQCRLGKNNPDPLPYPSDSTKPYCMSDEDWRKEKPGRLIQYYAQRTLNAKVQAMMNVFQKGLDVHLSTAVSMLRRSGGGFPEGDISDWLATLTGAEMEALKLQAQEPRQRAKAFNFGLLYGMKARRLWVYGITDYRLKWTIEEAAAGRDEWFQMYPEIGLWHHWSNYICSVRINASSVLIYNKYTGAAEQDQYDPKDYTSTTLAGRPLRVIKELNKILSYQGQGTGADILVQAVATLPSHLAARVIATVHDEILIHCEVELADQIEAELEKVMVAAGTKILGGMVPVKVEGSVGPCWKK